MCILEVGGPAATPTPTRTRTLPGPRGRPGPGLAAALVPWRSHCEPEGPQAQAAAEQGRSSRLRCAFWFLRGPLITVAALTGSGCQPGWQAQAGPLADAGVFAAGHGGSLAAPKQEPARQAAGSLSQPTCASSMMSSRYGCGSCASAGRHSLREQLASSVTLLRMFDTKAGDGDLGAGCK